MKRVLFVCIGNTCRSPMAEAFANQYGKDVLNASSAGIMPVSAVDPRTVQVMEERGIDVSLHQPTLYDPRGDREFDVVINMSGVPVHTAPLNGARILDWQVRDPYQANIDFYREIRDEIERLVMLFILDLRRLRALAAG